MARNKGQRGDDAGKAPRSRRARSRPASAADTCGPGLEAASRRWIGTSQAAEPIRTTSSPRAATAASARRAASSDGKAEG
jgi:hypothetical protein